MDIQTARASPSAPRTPNYDLVLNEALTMGLTYRDATRTLLSYFPYLAAPALGG
jgi:hypothetical protein